MNVKVTNKQLKNNYHCIIDCGYCAFSSFKSMMREIGYNCGVYGWNYTAYELTQNIALVDSYRGAPSQGLTKAKEAEARKLIDEYNKKIGAITDWTGASRGAKKRLFNNLVKKINKLIED